MKTTKTELRIVLVGMTGSGKSSTGNTIIGRSEEFQAKCDGNSITRLCKHAATNIEGRTIIVVDTPGLFDTRLENEITAVELTRCVYLTAPGPHAIIIVVRGADRQTEQVQTCADIIMDIFGYQARRFMIVLFTRRDDLEYHETSLSEYVTTLPDTMQSLIRACGDRYVAFNNRCTVPKDNISQVKELLKKIDEMVAQNGGRCFTSYTYKEFEERLKKKELEIRVHLEKMKQEEVAEIRNQAQREIRVKKEEEQVQHNQFAVHFRREREKTISLQNQLERSRENEIRMKDRQQEERERRIEAEINERMNKTIRDQEDKFNEKIATVREDVRKEIESDTQGTGDLIVGGLKSFTIGIGQALVKGGTKILNMIFG